ncbi:hypothetical protein WA158_000346 [Blastocystis sp. Blastoise]
MPTKVQAKDQKKKRPNSQVLESLKILSSFESKKEDVDEYVTSGYRRKTSCEQYFFSPLRWILSAIVVLLQIIDPIYVVVICIMCMTSDIATFVSVLVITVVAYALISFINCTKQFTFVVIELICHMILRIVSICLRSNSTIDIVTTSYIISMVSLFILIVFIIYEQISECCHCKA